jgi:O-acetyl-ADP-ribose deacetylase (regulator of RNase III)
MKLHIIKDDITKINVDCIVNAANPTLLGGGGVDGAIHKAAGPNLLEVCKGFDELEPGVRCRVGQTVTTGGFNLPANYIIHTVGPIFNPNFPCRAGEDTVTDWDEGLAILRNTYMNCFATAVNCDFKSIAFPAISAGVYGCPINISAIAVGEAFGHWQLQKERNPQYALEDVYLVLFQDSDYEYYQKFFEEHPNG